RGTCYFSPNIRSSLPWWQIGLPPGAQGCRPFYEKERFLPTRAASSSSPTEPPAMGSCFTHKLRASEHPPEFDLGSFSLRHVPMELRHAQAPQQALVAATRRRASMVGGKKLVDRASTKPEVEDGKSLTDSSQPNRGPP